MRRALRFPYVKLLKPWQWVQFLKTLTWTLLFFPIFSNISKIRGSTVGSRLRSFLALNNLFDAFQSDFLLLRSTETALVRVVSDLLLSGDSASLSVLLVLELGSTFVTVYRGWLLSRLSDVGVTGAALSRLTWFLYLDGFTFLCRTVRRLPYLWN